jgi:hypothetical protein
MTKKRISIIDAARSARKLQEEKDGKREISDFSTPAIRTAALGFENQYKDDKRRAGSANKKRQGIWIAVCHLRREDPHMDADSLWNNLDGKTIDDRWDLDLDGKRINQYDRETEVTTSIAFSTFVRHYYSQAIAKK